MWFPKRYSWFNQDGPHALNFPAEKDIEKHGLIVGKDTHKDFCKKKTSYICVRFSFIASVALLALLWQGYTINPRMLCTADWSTGIGSVNNNEIQLAHSPVLSDLMWTFAGYEDAKCATGKVNPKNGTAPADCQNLEKDISALDFDGANTFTICLWTQQNCQGVSAGQYSNSNLTCQNAYQATAYKMISNSDRCNPE